MSGKLPPPVNKKRYTYIQLLAMSHMQCEYGMCHYSVNKIEHLMQHVVDHGTTLGEPTKEGYMCLWRDCEFLSEKKDELLRHLYFHAFHAKVKAVGEVLSNNANVKCLLNPVTRNVLPDLIEELECVWGDCYIKFVSAQHYYWHTAAHANGELKENNVFSCKWKDCTMKFKNTVRLREHVRAHTQEKLAGCPTCGSMFSHINNFEHHCERQSAVPNPDFQCSHCKRCYATEKLLRDHVSKHINRYKCPQCPLTATTKTSLEKHIMHRHTNNKPFACPECPKRFKSSSDLGRHILLHSKVKSFGCPYLDCNFVGKIPSYVTTHLTKEHSGKPGGAYQCHMCERTFKVGTALTNHLKTLHNFHWADGYVRFRYRKHEDGYYRLQTTRIESVELAEQLDKMNQNADEPQPLQIDHENNVQI